jgi:hypothetical protein
MDLTVKYFECDSSGYVQTEHPYWLERSYSEPINRSDTGILGRTALNARIVVMVLRSLGKRGGTVVDCAGGYGILVRMLRDYGLEALWADKYCANLLARGFEYRGGKAELVTSFEAFEHFVDPVSELKDQLSISSNVLLSTALIPDPAPGHNDWWYYGSDHGQHIGFFRRRTLKYLAEKFGKRLVSDGRWYHLFADQGRGPMLWRTRIFVLRALSKVLRVVSACSLRSKTWEDHEQLARSAYATKDRTDPPI